MLDVGSLAEGWASACIPRTVNADRRERRSSWALALFITLALVGGSLRLPRIALVMVAVAQGSKENLDVHLRAIPTKRKLQFKTNSPAVVIAPAQRETFGESMRLINGELVSLVWRFKEKGKI